MIGAFYQYYTNRFEVCKTQCIDILCKWQLIYYSFICMLISPIGVILKILLNLAHANKASRAD